MIQRIKNNAFAWNSLVLFSGSMITNVFNYLFHLVSGRLVTPAAYGEIESLVSLLNIVSVPSMAIVMIATKYSACDKADNCPQNTKGVFQYLSRKTLVFSLAAFIILVMLSPAISKALKIGSAIALILVWLTMLLAFFGSINVGILNGWQRFKESSLASAGGAGAKLIVGIILMVLGYQVGGAIGGFVTAGVAGYLVSLYFLRPIFDKNHDRSGIEPTISFSSIKSILVSFLLGNLAINMLSNVDMVLAKRNLHEDLAGQYGALTIVAKIIFFATGVIATVVFSMAAENTHKKQSSRTLLVQSSVIIGLISALSTIFYFLFPEFVLGILFGQKYSMAAGYLGWFAVAVSLFSLNNLFLQFLLSVQRNGAIYASLGISVLMVPAIILYGHSISAIITIVILSQLLALISALLCLFITAKQQKTA